MGVCISHAIGVEKGRVKSVLDRAQAVAEQLRDEQASKVGIKFTVRRLSERELYIDIGGCETLAFSFDYYEKYEARAIKERFDYAHSVLQDHYNRKTLATADNEHLSRWPNQRIMWSADFCKTQYGSSVVEHKWVAELTRMVAMYASHAYVNDEADYYHTGRIEDASEGIAENGAIIASVGGMLAGQGFEIIKGGDTKIKPRGKK